MGKLVKKLLILGGGHSEIPLIKAAKALGFYTITTGYDKDGLGHPYADAYIFADFSDKAQILQIVQEHQIDFLIPSCNDFAILTAAFVNEHVTVGVFDSYEITKQIHHKTAFKTLAFELNLSVAKSKMLKQDSDLTSIDLSYPLIVKPIDLSGGKGVTKVETPQELKKGLAYAFEQSREQSILVEEFIEGSHHSCSLLIKDHHILFSFFADEYFYLNPYLVEGAYANPQLKSDIKNRILADSQHLIDNLDLCDGILHIQFIIKDDKPYILEITRRSPGDLYIDLVSYATSIDYAKAIVSLHTNSSYTPTKKDQIQKSILRHCIMADQNGYIQEVTFSTQLKTHIFHDILWYKKGETIEDFMKHKVGIVFAQFETIDQLKNTLSHIHKHITVKVSK